jgi:hypothetical protein
MNSDLVTSKLYTMGDIVRQQRSERGLAYEAMMKGYQKLRASKTPQHKAMYDALVADVESMRQKGVSPSTVHSNTFLSNMSVMYANDAYIGEQLVTVVPVSKRSDTFAIYPQRERFEYPDDKLGERSMAQEISESRTSDTYSLLDYGFSNFVSQATLDNQDPIFDEMADLLGAILEGIANKREQRISSTLTTASNYSGNTTTLAGSDQWDSTSGGNPIKDIQTAIASLFNGPGMTRVVGFTSLNVFNVLARHPTILDNLKYTRAGLVSRAELAQYFGLDDLLVGAARKQTANEGQTAAYSRMWGLDFGVVRVASTASKRTASFASLFRENGDPVTTEWFEPNAGKKGGYFAKVGVSEDLKVVAANAGYIIKAATAA